MIAHRSRPPRPRTRWVLALSASLTILTVLASLADAAPRYMRGRWALGVFTGPNFPVADFNEILKTGWGVDITGEYYLSNVISLGAYLEGVINNPQPSYESPDFGANARFASLSLIGRFSYPKTKLQPYLLVGGGGYNREVEVADRLTQASSTYGGDTVPGIMGGGGVVYPLSFKADILIEGTYHALFLEEEAGHPDTQGYVNAMVGVRLLLGGLLD